MEKSKALKLFELESSVPLTLNLTLEQAFSLQKQLDNWLIETSQLRRQVLEESSTQDEDPYRHYQTL